MIEISWSSSTNYESHLSGVSGERPSLKSHTHICLTNHVYYILQLTPSLESGTSVIMGGYEWISTIHHDGQIPTVQSGRSSVPLAFCHTSSLFLHFHSTLPHTLRFLSFSIAEESFHSSQSVHSTVSLHSWGELPPSWNSESTSCSILFQACNLFHFVVNSNASFF